MDNFFHILDQLMPLSPSLKETLKSKISVQTGRKGETLISQGKICNQLFFIERGFLRGFQYQNGKEVTTWFGFENDFATSTYSFITQRPGFENIEIVEDCILFALKYDDLNDIYLKYPEFNHIGRLLTERYYIELIDRTIAFQFLSAKENYEQLIKRQPHILQRASLGHVASYLGISQETLSRIRNKKKSR